MNKRGRKPTHQFDFDTYHNALEQWKKDRVEGKQMSNLLGRWIYTCCNIHLSRPSFKNYTNDWKQDMTDKAVMFACKYIHNYDINKLKKKDPTNYLFTIINSACISTLKDNKSNLLEDDKLDNIADDYNSEITFNNLGMDWAENEIDNIMAIFLNKNSSLENRLYCSILSDSLIMPIGQLSKKYKYKISAIEDILIKSKNVIEDFVKQNPELISKPKFLEDQDLQNKNKIITKENRILNELINW